MLLVAPPDLERQAPAIEPLSKFGSPSRQPLPFRSRLVASEDDPYMGLDSAETLAEDWRSKFVNAGLVGHIIALPDSAIGWKASGFWSGCSTVTRWYKVP
jgi:predicted alpha/beta hydrolase family esterase